MSLSILHHTQDPWRVLQAPLLLWKVFVGDGRAAQVCLHAETYAQLVSTVALRFCFVCRQPCGEPNLSPATRRVLLLLMGDTATFASRLASCSVWTHRCTLCSAVLCRTAEAVSRVVTIVSYHTANEARQAKAKCSRSLWLLVSIVVLPLTLGAMSAIAQSFAVDSLKTTDDVRVRRTLCCTARPTFRAERINTIYFLLLELP